MKILIWDNIKLSNKGGPSGYLYNIHEYLKFNPNDQIYFLSDVLKLKFQNTNISSSKSTHKNKNKILFGIKQIINIVWRWYHKVTPKLPKDFDLNIYDYIHFHNLYLALSFRNKYPKYKGKLILTNHSPSPAIDEFLTPHRWLSFMRPIGIIREVQCFESADYCMFPCKEAREPYECDVHLKKSFSTREGKMFYVPSSINDIDIDERKIQKFTELGIPENSFVISYFGRHNYIKGYDIIKKVGEALLDKYPNLYFVCGGSGIIPPLEHKRWIELGFVNNTHELLYQSDLYISANRETYFDLVVLEVLRSSTKILLSNTGGNKYFKQIKSDNLDGIDLFDINDLPALISKVENQIKLKIINPKEFKRQGASNRKLFLEYFTIDKYVDRYINAIKNLK